MSAYYVSQSYKNAAAVTPSDTADNYGSGFYVGGAGAVSVITEGGQTVTFTAAFVGQIIPIRFTQIRATGTTATNIVRVW